MLRAEKKSTESEKVVNSDKGAEGEQGFKDSGRLREGQKGTFDMSGRSPARSSYGDGGDGSKSEMGESDLSEFRGGLQKSPLRERFLNDLSSSPARSRNASPSPLSGRGSGDVDFDGVGISPARSRNVSKSPMRNRGSKSPMSVRTPNYSRSPMRGTNGASRSPARSLNGDISYTRLRGGVVSDLDENAEEEQEGMGVNSDGPIRRHKMIPKTSFNEWLPDDNHFGVSNDDNFGRRKTNWRDVVGDEADRISEVSESVYADEQGMTSEGSVDGPIKGSDFRKGRTDRNSRFGGGFVRGNGKPRAADQRFVESEGTGMFHDNTRRVSERERISVSSSAIDGPSAYHPDSMYMYGHSRHSFEVPRGTANAHYSEHVEFMQKYKGSMQQYPSKQLSNLDDEPFSSPGFYSGGGVHSKEDMRFRRHSMQQFSTNKDMPRPPYYNHGPDMIHELEDIHNHLPLYDDPFAGPMDSEQHLKQPQMLPRARRGYGPGQSLDLDRDPFRSYHNGMHRRLPADWQGDDLSSYGYRISQNLAAHPTSYSMDLQQRGPQTYDPRMPPTAPRVRPTNLAPHARRILGANQNKRLCLPIAGGAPFVVCHSCFELLKLPAKFVNKQKNEYKLQCGACSSITSFGLQNKSFSVLSSQNKPDPVNACSGFGKVLNESGPRHHRDSFAATSTNLGSYDFDASGHSFQSMESEANAASRRQRLVSNLDENTRAVSPSSRSSKDERIPENASIRSSRPNSSEISSKVRPPPGSPLRAHLDYSGQYHKAEAEVARNFTEEEKPVLEKDASQDSSVVNTAVASETEVYSHELPTSLSDSGDVPRDYKGNNENKSSRPAFWKSFASRSGHASPGKSEVYVNGQQVPHHVVKKAEKLAGSIQPGNYWYDPKAGFWGVMGDHCLGIIPPSIQEFSFPMPESCSKGDTAVFVNGRELHKKDLELLVSRGLPNMRDKRYIIDMSGKVLEEQSKDFIANLGKLAPTVEKNKRGFGMRVPGSIIEAKKIVTNE
ncbi:uncharacterized protein LOC104892186 isoform X2 [Beta vulgaris subsp. vulgaris]|nr:uncharacterized protein LOC104892186 isoform X2 [Beta vulgaris subsp. vulgaris]